MLEVRRATRLLKNASCLYTRADSRIMALEMQLDQLKVGKLYQLNCALPGRDGYAGLGRLLDDKPGGYGPGALEFDLLGEPGEVGYFDIEDVVQEVAEPAKPNPELDAALATIAQMRNALEDVKRRAVVGVGQTDFWPMTWKLNM